MVIRHICMNRCNKYYLFVMHLFFGLDNECLNGDRLFDYLSENALNFPVIHHIEFPKGIHR